MVMTDPIADALTRIRNGNRARFPKVDIPCSRVKIGLAKILKEEGYIKHFKILRDSKQGLLRIFLKYDEEGEPVIHSIQRVSRPGRRVYIRNREIRPVRGGAGIQIISTSKGLMSGRKARKAGLGGERVCVVY